MERAVGRGWERKKQRVVKKMGVDEKSLGKGHNYLTLVYDLEAATVVHIGDDRRKEENRELKREGDDVLTGTKYLWLYSRENLPEKHRGMFSVLRRKRLRTARAWAFKESLRDFWVYRSPAWALKHCEAWYAWAIRSQLKPIKDVARMFRKYLVNILTFLKHRITNVVSEGLNSTIQTIKKTACGFRNREHFKIVIYFHCGGLNLYPVTHKNVG